MHNHIRLISEINKNIKKNITNTDFVTEIPTLNATNQICYWMSQKQTMTIQLYSPINGLII